jgi:hypothetical protein
VAKALMAGHRAEAPSLDVGLSAKGLANIPRRVDDFTFLVGSRRYHCPSLIAEFLSPRVSELHGIDDTVREFCVEVDAEDARDVFGAFI